MIIDHVTREFVFEKGSVYPRFIPPSAFRLAASTVRSYVTTYYGGLWGIMTLNTDYDNRPDATFPPFTKRNARGIRPIASGTRRGASRPVFWVFLKGRVSATETWAPSLAEAVDLSLPAARVARGGFRRHIQSSHA